MDWYNGSSPAQRNAMGRALAPALPAVLQLRGGARGGSGRGGGGTRGGSFSGGSRGGKCGGRTMSGESRFGGNGGMSEGIPGECARNSCLCMLLA